MLRRYGAHHTPSGVAYELAVIERLVRAGWPAARPVSAPIEVGGRIWCAFEYLPGRKPSPRRRMR